MSRFLNEPVSVRGAAGVIVAATALVVAAGAGLMTLFDHREFQHFGLAVWWALQTVTTVGYGDVVPSDVVGRIVAGIVMFEGIALVAIATAAVTSTFVERAQQARQVADAAEEAQEQARIDARFDDVDARLERIESMLLTLTKH